MNHFVAHVCRAASNICVSLPCCIKIITQRKISQIFFNAITKNRITQTLCFEQWTNNTFSLFFANLECQTDSCSSYETNFKIVAFDTLSNLILSELESPRDSSSPRSYLRCIPVICPAPTIKWTSPYLRTTPALHIYIWPESRSDVYKTVNRSYCTMGAWFRKWRI